MQHSLIITSIRAFYKSKPNSFLNSSNIPNIQTPNHISNNLRLTLTKQQDIRTIYIQFIKTYQVKPILRHKLTRHLSIYIFIRRRKKKKAKTIANAHLQHKPNAPKRSSTSSIKQIIAKSNVKVTYPLDSLSSYRALGSTCPLLGGLIHQLPTLNPHTNRSPYQPQTNIFTDQKKRDSEKRRVKVLPGVFTIRCWLDLVA